MNDSISVSNWSVMSDGLYPQVGSGVVTTDDLLAICGAMDTNALIVASIGLFLSFAYLVFVRRFRDGMSEKHRVLLDKAFMTTLMMLFVGIIIRVMRAG